jgi:hypothetical protein
VIAIEFSPSLDGAGGIEAASSATNDRCLQA